MKKSCQANEKIMSSNTESEPMEKSNIIVVENLNVQFGSMEKTQKHKQNM